MIQFYKFFIRAGNFLQNFFLLAIRLFWGYSFFQAGWGKLNNIEPVIGFFEKLEIPLPALNAYLVGSLEAAGGLLLLLGLASRLISVPLAVIMIVALFTAHSDALWGAFDNPQRLINQTPFNYLFTTIIVFCFGPGKISLDALFSRLFKGKE